MTLALRERLGPSTVAQFINVRVSCSPATQATQLTSQHQLEPCTLLCQDVKARQKLALSTLGFSLITSYVSLLDNWLSSVNKGSFTRDSPCNLDATLTVKIKINYTQSMKAL